MQGREEQAGKLVMTEGAGTGGGAVRQGERTDHRGQSREATGRGLEFFPGRTGSYWSVLSRGRPLFKFLKAP